MIEVQVAQNHHVDIVLAEAKFAQGSKQDVLAFDDAVPLFELGLEERTHAGVEQDAASVRLFDQQAAAG